MAQPLSIVHNIEQGFNERGQVSESRESYIKLETSFRRGPLAAFSGSQLKVFLCIALHEADDEPGASFSTIAREAGLCRQSVISAIGSLSDKERPFIRYAGREADGTNRYRVNAFIWCGSDKDHKIASPKNRLADEKNIFLHHDDDKVPHSDSELKNHHHTIDGAENVFRSAGFSGPNLIWLGRNVACDVADAWAEWVKTILEDDALLKLYSKPHGYAWTCLRADPKTLPPQLPHVEKDVAIPEATVLGHGIAGEMWHDVLTYLHLDDRKSMVDFVNTRVVDWDNDGKSVRVVIFDPSRYIVKRLLDTIVSELRILTESKFEIEIEIIHALNECEVVTAR